MVALSQVKPTGLGRAANVSEPGPAMVTLDL